MIKIGKHIIKEQATLQESLKLIRQYLHGNKLIIVNEKEEPMQEDDIIKILESDSEPVFLTKGLYELEKETLEENLRYIKYSKDRIMSIIDSPEQKEVNNAFIELIDAFQHFEKIGVYFNIQKIHFSENLLEKALKQMEMENTEYIVELLEYECLPILNSIENSLKERTIN